MSDPAPTRTSRTAAGWTVAWVVALTAVLVVVDPLRWVG